MVIQIPARYPGRPVVSHERNAVSLPGAGSPAPAAKKRRAPPPALPPSFVDELEQYLRWLTDPENGLGRVYPPSSIKQRRRELRLAASALAQVWGNPARVTALRVLVYPAHTQLILEAYLQRTHDEEPTAFMRALTSTLIALARHWVKPAPDELAQLVALRTKLQTTPTGPTAKNERLLRALADPDRRDALLALPAALATHARHARLSPARQRQAWRTAVAIELLLHTGMRLHQLATLRLGEHLTWPDGPQGALRIRAPGRQTRDGAALEFELVGAPQALVQAYLEWFGLQVRRQPPQPWLFANADGTRVSDAALADGIAKATDRGIGLCITPHQLRHVCATLLLTAFPGDYTTVKDLLGHQFLESTWALYGGQPRQAAIAEWHARLAQQRAPPTLPEAVHAQAA